MEFLPEFLDIDADNIYSSFHNYPACSIVEYVPLTNRCHYVKTTAECKKRVLYINYMEILYCFLRPSNETMKWMWVAFLMSFCSLIYLTLAIMVDKIFVPSLQVISKTVGMNEHLAGVTILAFGNGSPDLLSSFGMLNSNQKRSVLSDLFGAGIYVTSIVAGIVCLQRPFKLQPNNLLRDACFLLLSVLFIDYTMGTDNHVTVLESIQQTLRTLEELRADVTIEIRARSSEIRIDVEKTRKASYNAIAQPNFGLYSQLAESLIPFTKEEWKNCNPFMRVFLIIKGAITVILVFFIPVVDYELPRHGWSKLLNCFQICLLLPITFMVIFQVKILGIPIFLLALLFTTPAAVYIFLTTRTDIAPSYHGLISIYPILASCVVIYTCASQTVLIFNVLGIVTHLSNSFLGCTFQAWGNSIGDFVANIALARGGYPKMGYAACFGGPFFNSLLSTGGAFFYQAVQSNSGYKEVNQGILGENCVIFLCINITAILIWATFTDFNARRSVAYFNFTLYFLFILYACLGELEIIQTYAPEVYMNIFDHN